MLMLAHPRAQRNRVSPPTRRSATFREHEPSPTSAGISGDGPPFADTPRPRLMAFRRGTLPPVRDNEDVRAEMTRTVSRRMGQRRHILVPEVEVRWSIPARLDALLVADRIGGFEIKSDVDSLARLPRQVEAYGMVVELATLVVGERHRVAASALIPPWWSIWVVRKRNGDVAIRQVRGGRLNPSIDPLAVTSFLSREDLTHVLREHGHRRLSTMSVDALRIAATVELGPRGTLRYARTVMLARQDWRFRSLAGASQPVVQ